MFCREMVTASDVGKEPVTRIPLVFFSYMDTTVEVLLAAPSSLKEKVVAGCESLLLSFLHELNATRQTIAVVNKVLIDFILFVLKFWGKNIKNLLFSKSGKEFISFVTQNM